MLNIIVQSGCEHGESEFRFWKLKGLFLTIHAIKIIKKYANEMDCY